MHSILDVVAGLLVSYFMSKLFLKFAISFDYFIKLNFIYGLLFYAFCIIVCFIYPTRDRWSTARADTILILGVAAGLVMGMTTKYAFNLTNMGKLSLNFQLSFNYFFLFFSRFFCASAIVFFIRFIFKKLIFYIAITFFNCKKYLSIKNDGKISQSVHMKELTQKNFYFEFFLYFFTYSAVSYTVNFISFILFEIVSI